MTGKKPCIEWTRKPKIEQYNEVIYDKCLNKEDNKVYMNYRGIPIISVYNSGDLETFDKEETISTITDLGEYSTSDLVDELKQREGVEHININMKDRVEVAKEVPVNPGDEIKYNQAFDEYRYTYDTIDYGPMIILKIID